MSRGSANCSSWRRRAEARRPGGFRWRSRLPAFTAASSSRKKESRPKAAFERFGFRSGDRDRRARLAIGGEAESGEAASGCAASTSQMGRFEQRNDFAARARRRRSLPKPARSDQVPIAVAAQPTPVRQEAVQLRSHQASGEHQSRHDNADRRRTHSRPPSPARVRSLPAHRACCAISCLSSRSSKKGSRQDSVSSPARPIFCGHRVSCPVRRLLSPCYGRIISLLFGLFGAQGDFSRNIL
jgi:hypothetical protein